MLRAHLLPNQWQTLDREAPTHIAVPSGNRLAIQYEPGRPPILAVKIQEVFGWKATPRIAAGRVPLLLYLLAPNQRPQQITEDLESFWNNGYPVVRGNFVAATRSTPGPKTRGRLRPNGDHNGGDGQATLRLFENDERVCGHWLQRVSSTSRNNRLRL